MLRISRLAALFIIAALSLSAPGIEVTPDPGCVTLLESTIKSVASRGSLSQETILAALPEVFRLRLKVYNQVRRSQNLPAKRPKPFVVREDWPNNYLLQLPDENRAYGRITIYEPAYKTTLYFIGDAILDMDWSPKGGEFWQATNRAYVVKESGQIKERKLAEFLLNQMPGDYVDVVRLLSHQEKQMWEAKDLEGLNEGATKAGRAGWSYFTLGTKSVWPLGQSALTLRIPKAVALKWAAQNDLYMAAMPELFFSQQSDRWNALPLEVSIHQKVWKEAIGFAL